MSSRRFLLVVGAPTAVGGRPEFANRCVDLATLRAATTGQNGKLIELTPDQWQFLRGIYAIVVGNGKMFSLIAIFAIMLSAGAIPIIIASLFLRARRDDLASQRELLATTVEVEKMLSSWRARHQTPDREL